MTTDLIEMVTSSLSPRQIENTASTVNLPAARVRQVMPGVVAAVLGTLMHRASTPLGRANIIDALPAYASPERVLGTENVEPVTDAVAHHARVSRAAAGSLLAIASAAVMGFLGKLVTTRRLNAEAIPDYLATQRASITATAPVGLAGALGEVRPARVYLRDKRRLGAALAALAAVVILVGAYALMHRTRPYEPPTITGVNVPASTTAKQNALDEAFTGTMSLPAKLPLGTIEFPFGSATPTDESIANIDALATALQAHPGAHVRLDGHIDAIGKEDFNQTLATERAAAVKSLLQERGVDADNVTIAGHSEIGENCRVEATLLSR
jgi:outer membrane protein OmpA-like peptidoglycan-associated protein